MKNKIILFIPLIDDGGVEKNFFYISKYLKDKKKNLSIISFSKNQPFDKKNLFQKFTEKYFNTLSRRLKIIVCLFQLIKIIIRNKNSIVLSFQGNIYSIIICKLMMTKIVVRSNASLAEWTKNPFKRFLYKIIYKMADKIIVNSKALKKELFTIFNLTSTCIYNPVDRYEILKKSKVKIKLNKFNKKKINIISIGRLVEQKDHLTTIYAINSLKKKYNINLLIIGSGSHKKILNNKIDELNLNKNVNIIEYVNNPYPYLKKSDLLVLSSKFEGLPNVLLEAIALDIFVISSNCPTGPKEILDNGKGGLLFNVGNFKSLAKKIEIFIKFKKIINKKKQHAFSRLERFDFKKRLNDYIEVINKVS